jgi:hypothetical protein
MAGGTRDGQAGVVFLLGDFVFIVCDLVLCNCIVAIIHRDEHHIHQL